MNFSVSVEEYEHISNVFEQYKHNFPWPNNSTSDCIVHKAYGVGGKLLHRGFFCPSLIFDIVNGNVSRGKIYSSKPAIQTVDFVYGFDEHDKLISIDRGMSQEFIVSVGNKDVGITINNSLSNIESIAECSYQNGKICSYIYALYCNSDMPTEILIEYYTYFESGMSVDWRHYYLFREQLRSEHTVYIFSSVDGYLANYNVHHYDGEQIKKICSKEHTFKVYKRRKIN